MKTTPPVFHAMANRHLVLLTLILLAFAGPAWGQITININNSSAQTFALDSTDHFLYVAENSNAGTKNLSVINTLTNTVVGTYSYSSGGYTSQVAASGLNVFWADQGSSQVKVISVNGSGAPSLTRNDGATLATGMAALSSTYAVSMQGTGDNMDIRNYAGSTLFTVGLGGVAGQVYADSNTNRYYARSTNSYKVIDASTGSVLSTLNGFVMAIDSSATHNFVYLQDGTFSTRLDQLNGSTDAQTTFYDFGFALSDVAVNSATGDIFVALGSQNSVIQLNSSMAFVHQYTVSSPQNLAFADGELFVHSTGAAYVTAITAIPEPATWSALLGGLGLVAAALRRRATRGSA